MFIILQEIFVFVPKFIDKATLLKPLAGNLSNANLFVTIQRSTGKLLNLLDDAPCLITETAQEQDIFQYYRVLKPNFKRSHQLE